MSKAPSDSGATTTRPNAHGGTVAETDETAAETGDSATETGDHDGHDSSASPFTGSPDPASARDSSAPASPT
ncbi:hypothetical protein ACFYT3_23895 [Nocardia amikacinitolerans]|uniref:hypothetical protein n=1 Tax=Nocardia amikacinitolerans TaxID=756689 RepID=UPI0036984F07